MMFPFEKYLGLIAMGFGVGAYGTLIGAGGGFVLMPILLLLYPDRSPELLTSISLAVVFFNAVSGSEAYALMKRIDYKSGFLFALATIPGSILGALNTAMVPRRLFDIIFSVLLICASIFLMFRSGPPKETCKEPCSKENPFIFKKNKKPHWSNLEFCSSLQFKHSSKAVQDHYILSTT